jgi:hypothetical protein
MKTKTQAPTKTDRKVDPYWSRLNRQIAAADRMEARRQGRKA